MKKIAIFVEGQTEQVFVRKLLEEIAGRKNIYIETQMAKIDRNGNRYFTVIRAASASGSVDRKYYVLIRDCGSESNVKTDIRDSLESLSRSGYEKIIGLRDVYPLACADIPRLEFGLRYEIPTRFIPVSIILAIMEVEAWFLAEVEHFVKIDPTLTASYIKTSLGFDPSIDNVEQRPHPAQDLDDIYHLAGFSYKKKKSSIQRTISALDYNALYLIVRDRVPSLNKFIEQIDSFMI